MFARDRIFIKKFLLRGLLAFGATALLACSIACAAPKGKAQPARAPRAGGSALPLKIRGTQQFPVYFRSPLPVTSPQVRYPGYHPEKAVLRAGTVRTPGAMPLVCDIMLERDVPIKLRDGAVIFADVFRPVEDGRFPALLCLGYSGKEIGSRSLDDFPDRMGLRPDETSGLEVYNGLDPAWWVSQGYVVVNPDPRGVCSSNGNICYFGRQLAEDGHDIVEWIALQPWCSGRVGMAGCGELAASQWFVAAEQPPHLEAIAPWGGFSDLYREVAYRGGIPSTAYADETAAVAAGKGKMEDLAKMISSYPFMNAYWDDKAARLEEITVPAYVAAPCVNETLNGCAFDGFRRIAGHEKWLNVLTIPTERGLYDPDAVVDLLNFFDYYLKDMNNGWEKVPHVRLAVYDPERRKFLPRDEEEFPLSGTQETCLYLDMSEQSLSWTMPEVANAAAYDIAAEDPAVMFTYRFDKDIELTGFMALHLWAATEADDMDIAVRVERLDRNGRPQFDDNGLPVAITGKIRASCGDLDENRSVAGRPVLSGAGGEKLPPGIPIYLEIAFDPISTIFREGETLCLTIMPYSDETQTQGPPFGSARIEIPRDTFTFDPDAKVPMQTLGVREEPKTPDKAAPAREEKTRTKGAAHIFYGGGEYDSYILLPVIPPRLGSETSQTRR